MPLLVKLLKRALLQLLMQVAVFLKPLKQTLLRFLKSGQYQGEALAARQRRGFWLCPWLIVQACKAC